MSLSDAFVKAGLVSPDKAKKVEDAKEAEKKKKERKPKGDPAPHKEINLSQEEYSRLEKLWKGEKSKGFMKHLIWAFSFHLELEKVYGAGAEGEDKLDKECCLCRRKIISVSESVDIVGDKASDNLSKSIKFEMANKDRLDTEDFKKEYAEFLERMGKEMFGNKRLGLKSKESTKVICFPCYQVFHNWISERLLRGDRSVNSIIQRRIDNL